MLFSNTKQSYFKSKRASKLYTSMFFFYETAFRCLVNAKYNVFMIKKKIIDKKINKRYIYIYRHIG